MGHTDVTAHDVGLAGSAQWKAVVRNATLWILAAWSKGMIYRAIFFLEKRLCWFCMSGI